ncbi:hypothetical protein DOY81_011010 [Sarcophaga bullata]|nr:hypothetical protein DOY81_011010 [Sarcophaga bullata]
MSAKRKYDSDEDLQNIHVSNKKHTLDSDEEDSDDYEKDEIGDSDIEGEEDGVSKVRDEIKITPFNMREELEEGHFDKDGLFHWDRTDEIKDNWLDNVDWIKIEKENKRLKEGKDGDLTYIDTKDTFNELQIYKELFSHMKKGESVAGTLRRLDKSRNKMSTAERIKLKKQGFIDKNAENIIKITELANEILTKSGNMDVYQLTYDCIKNKISSFPGTSREANASSESCMYSDEFNEKAKEKCEIKEVFWEFKWKEDDTAIQGPFNTLQMLKWSRNGYFKSGVYARKVGDLTKFYTSNRIDFDLYL